ncbi:NepR family anti-sigma factor [Zavarzinia sp. CC-PAN008]|uniref:NepR family anti-sigma factor n=1 Tax=Zavarzinia sp. CC-PAN008 TaxID=3243332 RepID=UPI003F742AEB
MLGSDAGRSRLAEQGVPGGTLNESAIDGQLRTLYANVLDEPIPDHLMALLDQLRDTADDGAPAAPAPDRQP